MKCSRTLLSVGSGLLGIIFLATAWATYPGRAAPASAPRHADTAQVLATETTASTTPHAHVTYPNNTLSLVTEPDAGIAPVLSLINSASSSIDLVMYHLSDKNIEQALANAEARGVSVRVILNPGYRGKQEKANQDAYAYLDAHHVPVHWSPSYFSLTHQKTLVIDKKAVLVMTFNFTPQYYDSSRDFALRDTDPTDVGAIETAFAADWDDRKIPNPPDTDLVWSPGSEQTLVDLINSATKTLLIYNEEMNDDAVTAALVRAAQRGVDVHIVMTYQSTWSDALTRIANAGAHVATYAPNAPLYIHAKMIIANNARAFLGSENFSYGSLEQNRELGVLFTNTNIIASLAKTFAQDEKAARPFASATQTTASSTVYYTSSFHSAKYYYPSTCPDWQGLSTKYLVSFPTLSALQAKYPTRTLASGC